MPQFMVAVYHPDDYDPSTETTATIEAIHPRNREMIAAGARKLACGIAPVRQAKSLPVQRGTVLVTDGPYVETKEHIGGFWIGRPRTWRRRWPGRARGPSPVGRRARSANCCSDRQ